MSFTVFYLGQPSHQNGPFLGREPNPSHVTKLQISLVQHFGPCGCEATQQHVLLGGARKGGITKTHFPTRRNPAKYSSITLRRNGAGSFTEPGFRSLRSTAGTRIAVRHFVHPLPH